MQSLRKVSLLKNYSLPRNPRFQTVTDKRGMWHSKIIDSTARKWQIFNSFLVGNISRNNWFQHFFVFVYVFCCVNYIFPEAYSEPCQTCKIKLLTKIVHG